MGVWAGQSVCNKSYLSGTGWLPMRNRIGSARVKKVTRLQLRGFQGTSVGSCMFVQGTLE